ncbi:hypothetical protein POTG_02797 [Paenibacillus sp. oral taxon 786 str. D14]|nr:hypothetical protein POTG_02797 [Paenibacillus sp. oral taxon 786 str. D14]
MGLWSKEQLRAFNKENKLATAEDGQNASERAVRRDAPRNAEGRDDEHLSYEKHKLKAKMTPNSRNGKSKKAS